MKQKFKQYICQYYNTECFDKLKSNVINLDDIIKYGEVLFKLLNDDGNYKYEDTTIFSNLFTAIRMSVMSSSKISNQEQLLKIFDLSRINDLEKRKQAKDQFQKFLEGLERQSPTSPSLPPR